MFSPNKFIELIGPDFVPMSLEGNFNFSEILLTIFLFML